MVISLVSKDVSEVDYKFTHMGSVEICNKCPLKKVCVDSLKENNNYIITNVKRKEHSCLIDGRKMVVCEVKEIKPRVSVRKQKHLEGMTIKRKPLECNEILCEHYSVHCCLVGFDKEMKIKIIKELEEIQCPLKYDLVLVEAEKKKSSR